MAKLRELRFVRRKVDDLETACQFAGETFGLMAEDRSDTDAFFRADTRFYSLCLSTPLPDAIGFSVGLDQDLDSFAQAFKDAGHIVQVLQGDDAAQRAIKRGIAVIAPNGIQLEIVWRHLESGHPYHGPRDTGMNGFAAVQLASTDPTADQAFWKIAGLVPSDYAGDAAFLTLGVTHHQIAIYPSERDGLLGAIWQVGSIDHVMRQWHIMLNRQVPVAHGPGRQTTSKAAFVNVKAPDGLLMCYATEMDTPPANGPRQFADTLTSHCAWGSPTDLTEFKGDAT